MSGRKATPHEIRMGEREMAMAEEAGAERPEREERMTTSTAQHTPGPDCLTHLIALKAAADEVQPLSDYRGNFAALAAVCELDAAIAAVLADIAPFVDHARARAAAPELLAALQGIVASLTWEEKRSGTTYAGYARARAAIRKATEG